MSYWRIVATAAAFLLLSGLAAARPLDVSEALDALEPGWRIPLAVAADGQAVAYSLMQPSRKQPMLEADAYRSRTGVFAEAVGNDVWIADQRGPRKISPGYSPVWSPDGSRLAFLSDRDGLCGLWVWEAGKVRRVSPATAWFAVPFERPVWTRDGKSLIVKLLPPGMSVAQAAARENPRGAVSQQSLLDRRQLPARVYTSSPTPTSTPASQKLTSVADLALVNLADGRARILARGVTTSGWWTSPEGRLLAYTVGRGPGSDDSQMGRFDLCVCDLKTGTSRVVAPLFPSDFGMGVSWSPDGRQLAYCTLGNVMDESADADVCCVALDGSAPRTLARGGYFQEYRGPHWIDPHTLLLRSREGLFRCGDDGSLAPLASFPGRSVRELVAGADNGSCWSEGGAVLALLSDTSTKKTSVARVDLASGNTSVWEHSYAHSGVGVAGTGSRIYTQTSDPSLGEALDLSTDGLRTSQRLHLFNRVFAARNMGRPRLLEYRSAAGKPLRAALLLPGDYQPGRRYPMVVVVYGGALASGRLNHFGLEGPGCDNMHILASRGFIVMAPDIPIDKNPVRDIVDSVDPALDAAIREGLADPARIAVMGHSYGGYSTLALITHSDRFKAAIARSGIADLLHEFLSFEDGRASHLALVETGQGNMHCTPWDNLPRYVENSPVLALHQVHTPLLLIHGDQDNRAWVEESGEVFVGLRRLGKPVTYVSYPGESHWEGTWTREHVLDYWQRTLDFLTQQLGPTP